MANNVRKSTTKKFMARFWRNPKTLKISILTHFNIARIKVNKKTTSLPY
jgi:hypothetical protein